MPGMIMEPIEPDRLVRLEAMAAARYVEEFGDILAPCPGPDALRRLARLALQDIQDHPGASMVEILHLCATNAARRREREVMHRLAEDLARPGTPPSGSQ